MLRESIACVMVLATLSLSGCLDDSGNNSNSGYVGSIYINQLDTKPIGLTKDSQNGLVMTAMGTGKGQVWNTLDKSSILYRTVVQSDPANSYSFSGSDFYNNGEYLYACYNSTVPGIGPSVVVLQRSNLITYKWIGAINFDANGSYCYSVIRVQDNLVATNSRPVNINSPAMYYANVSDIQNLPATMTSMGSYSTMFGYTAADITSGDMLTDIRLSTTQRANTYFYVLDHGRSNIYTVSIVSGITDLLVQKIVDSSKFSTKPTALTQYSDHTLIVAQLGISPDAKAELHAVELNNAGNFYKSEFLSMARGRKVSALITGRDYFGNIENPVIFALNAIPEETISNAETEEEQYEHSDYIELEELTNNPGDFGRVPAVDEFFFNEPPID